jgi:hypothetical protein
VDCSGECVNTQTDRANCGDCGVRCVAGEVCSAGLCELSCQDGLDNCNGICRDLNTDPANCGFCGNRCTTQLVCVGGRCARGCADGSVEQTFSNGMVGCAGEVRWVDRESLCLSGWHSCSSADWVAGRNGAAPVYHYWTGENLFYSGSQSACFVSTTIGNTACGSQGGGGNPMRVCAPTADRLDPLGNRCNWVSCGLDSVLPNEFFGGCSGNLTAGTLCCPD